MKDKYYTPTFEDFIPGLEYEYFDGIKWVRKKFNSLSHRADGSMNLSYELILRKDRFRVKLLEDMDTGWDINFHGQSESGGVSFTRLQNGNHFMIMDSDQHILIKRGKRILFDGYIKNKTELELILKMMSL